MRNLTKDNFEIFIVNYPLKIIYNRDIRLNKSKLQISDCADTN